MLFGGVTLSGVCASLNCMPFLLHQECRFMMPGGMALSGACVSFRLRVVSVSLGVLGPVAWWLSPLGGVYIA